VIPRSLGAAIVLTNKTVISDAAMGCLPDLRYIGVLATGYNVVDVDAASRRGIPVTNVPSYGTESVAQMTFAHLLNLCQHVAEHSDSVVRGNWAQSQDFCFWEFPLVELSGLTLGIVGMGRIGRAVARLGAAFGMRVLAYDPVKPSPLPDDVFMTDLETVFRESDVVTLHCPLTDENRGFVEGKLLSAMKETALLINTSRGPLVDEAALADALDRGIIAGAGVDVLDAEPPHAGSPLIGARNCYTTPHIAWATRAARQRLMDTAVSNVAGFLRGEPVNVVNGV
jgi:glycerate dehydrogenase